MRFANTLLLVCYVFVAGAQPKLLLQPSHPLFPKGFNPVNNQIYLGDYSNIKIFDWTEARLTTFPGCSEIKTSADGKLTAFYQLSQVLIINNESGESSILENDDTGMINMYFSQDNLYFAVEGDQFVSVYSAPNFSRIGKLKKNSDEEKTSGIVEQNLLIGSKKEVIRIKLPDLKPIDTLHLKDDFKMFINDGNFFLSNNFVFDSKKLKKIYSLEKLETGFGSSNSNNVPIINTNKKQIAIFGNWYNFKLLEFPALNTVFEKNLMGIATTSNSRFFQVDPGWRFFSVGNKQYGVTLFDIKTGAEKCQIYSLGTDDFIIRIPDGHYMATRRGALKGVTFELAGRMFDFNQFDEQFNRPDLVLAHVGLTPASTIVRFKKAYERRMARLKGGKTEFDGNYNTPEVSFSGELPLFTNDSDLKLGIQVIDQKESLNRLHISVNGVPLYGKNGYLIKPVGKKEYYHNMIVKLTPGDNKIEVEAVNQQKAVSQRLMRIVRYDVPESKSDLYLVTIGVSQYAEKDKDLLFPVKDADDVQKLFSSYDTVYEKVISLSVRDTEFSTEHLRKIKKDLLQSKENDCVIIFYAGHGLVDQELNYYLGSYDLDFSAPAQNGIPYTIVENLLDSIPARRRLLMIDACYSGEIDKTAAQRIKMLNTVKGNIRFRTSDSGLAAGNTEEERIFNLMREWFADVSVGTGATILSGSSGFQTAKEGEKWNNGVFTWCLLEGLKHRKADLNRDGKIMLSELRSYLESTVPDQTDRTQTPNFRTENLVIDWQIW